MLIAMGMMSIVVASMGSLFQYQQKAGEQVKDRLNINDLETNLKQIFLNPINCRENLEGKNPYLKDEVTKKTIGEGLSLIHRIQGDDRFIVYEAPRAGRKGVTSIDEVSIDSVRVIGDEVGVKLRVLIHDRTQTLKKKIEIPILATRDESGRIRSCAAGHILELAEFINQCPKKHEDCEDLKKGNLVCSPGKVMIGWLEIEGEKVPRCCAIKNDCGDLAKLELRNSL